MQRRFTWSERFSVGVPSIDEQHKFLISLIADLQDAMMGGSAREFLPELASRLSTYIEHHFGWEEQLMEQNGYPELSEHKEQHAELSRRAQEFSDMIRDGKLSAGTPVMRFLQTWLTEHISVSDKRVGVFLQECSVR